MTMDISLNVPAGPLAARTARRSLEPLREAVGDSACDEVRLLVSELVTNSSRHAGLEEGAPIHVHIETSDDRIRGEVSDPGEGFERPPPPRDMKESGWGLHLVSELSDRWGIEKGPRTAVWFELPLDVEGKRGSPAGGGASRTP